MAAPQWMCVCVSPVFPPDSPLLPSFAMLEWGFLYLASKQCQFPGFGNMVTSLGKDGERERQHWWGGRRVQARGAPGRMWTDGGEEGIHVLMQRKAWENLESIRWRGRQENTRV